MEGVRTPSAARALGPLVAVGLLLTGCGAGDEAASTDGDGDAAAYCDLVEELESQDSRPTDEQLDRLVSVAPDEIESDVELFSDAISSGDMEAEGVAEAESRILAWEEQNCR